MIHKKKCTICAIKFESVRSDKIYCSNACKQKAHTSKVRKVVEPAKQVFFLDEYTHLNERWGADAENFPFIFFCFLRTKLAQNVSRKLLEAYFDSVWTRESYDDLISSNAYRSFQEDFFANKALVV